MVCYTEHTPLWLNWLAPAELLEDNDLFRIVIFYVFHSPCVGLSAMGKTLQGYNWNTPWRTPYKLNMQLKEASSNKELIFSAKSYGTMSEALEKANLLDNFPSDLSKERICIYDCKKNQFLSVFFHIRNAFAHGRMNIVVDGEETIFILEDISNCQAEQCKVSARMIIRKSTLLNWIDLIEGGEKEYIVEGK